MSVSEVAPRVTLAVEFIGVEMSMQAPEPGCTACDKSRDRLLQAIEAARPLFETVGVQAKVVDHWIGTEREARLERIDASPTIRIGSVEVKPRHSDNTEGGRRWQWQGKDYTQPPVGLFLDLLMRGYALSRPADALDAAAISPYLKQFFSDEEMASQARTACS